MSPSLNLRRPSVFPLRFDDEEDPLDLGLVLQHVVQRRLDDLLAGLDAAPAIGPDLLDRLVDLQRQLKRRIAGDS